MSNTSDDAFSVEVLSINEKVLITESTSNPTVFPGYIAPIGSLLLNDIDGNLYNKYGNLDTDWNCVTIRTGRTIQFFKGIIQATVGTTIIPTSDLLPSITSGSEIWSQSIIPNSNNNLISIITNFSFAASANEMPGVACLFRNNICISAILMEGAANPDVGRPICFTCIDQPNSEGTSVTYSCRVGKMQGGGVWYINCTQSHSSLFGGALSADGFQLVEITN